MAPADGFVSVDTAVAPVVLGGQPQDIADMHAKRVAFFKTRGNVEAGAEAYALVEAVIAERPSQILLHVCAMHMALEAGDHNPTEERTAARIKHHLAAIEIAKTSQAKQLWAPVASDEKVFGILVGRLMAEGREDIAMRLYGAGKDLFASPATRFRKAHEAFLSRLKPVPRTPPAARVAAAGEDPYAGVMRFVMPGPRGDFLKPDPRWARNDA